MRKDLSVFLEVSPDLAEDNDRFAPAMMSALPLVQESLTSSCSLRRKSKGVFPSRQSGGLADSPLTQAHSTNVFLCGSACYDKACLLLCRSSLLFARRRRQAFCVVKEDGTEIGRTKPSGVGDKTGVLGGAERDGNDHDASVASEETTASDRAFEPGNVSWEDCQDDSNRFAVTLSPHRGGGPPLQLTVELWENIVDDSDEISDSLPKARSAKPPPGNFSSSADARRTQETSRNARQHGSVRRVGTARISAETLVLSTPGRLSLPLESSPSDVESTVKTGATTGVHIHTSDSVPGIPGSEKSGGKGTQERAAEEKTTVAGSPHPKVILGVTPQVGVHWGRRVMTAAKASKRVIVSPPIPAASNNGTPAAAPDSALSKDENDDGAVDAHVIYMTNAEGSARTWRAPVTPGNSIPLMDYEDALELVFASVPACCPRAPALLVAPVSDIGVRLGKSWIGPRVAARHAIVAHRPRYCLESSNVGGKCDGGGKKKDERKGTISSANGGGVAEEPPREDELFIRLVAAEAESLLRDIRARDMRAEQRRMALDRVREICDAWSNARERAAAPQQAVPVDDDAKESGERIGRGRNVDGLGSEEGEQRNAHEYDGDDIEEQPEEEEDDDDDDDDPLGGRVYGELCRGVLRALEMALPGVSIYLGLLESGAQSIRYVACTRQSSMAGKQLKRGEGISFSCVGPRYAPYLVYPSRGSGGSKHAHSSSSSRGAKQGGVISNEDEGEEAITTGSALSARDNPPHAERSLEEGVVSIQKVFRGKKDRDRLRHARQQASLAKKRSRRKFGRSAWKKPALQIPKVFDYEGRVGWPFVCVPLEGFLRSSSIGVLGLDTFEQMVNSTTGPDRPEAGLVTMVAEAARCVRERALHPADSI